MNVLEEVHLCILPNIISLKERLFLTSAFLSGEEEDRAALIKDVQKKDVFIQAHAFKRFILSRIINVPAASIGFYVNDFGKPFISHQINGAGVHFNFSQTVGLAAMITGSNSCIGIDVEHICDRSDISLLQEVTFHEAEIAEAKKLVDATERMDNFYAKWVIKESVLKAVGIGLSIDPKRLLVSSDKRGHFILKSAVINNPDSFKITVDHFMNCALAYSIGDTSDLNSNTPVSVYKYQHYGFQKV